MRTPASISTKPLSTWRAGEPQADALALAAARAGVDLAALVGCHPNHVPRMIAALRADEGAAAGGRASLDRPPAAALPASATTGPR